MNKTGGKARRPRISSLWLLANQEKSEMLREMPDHELMLAVRDDKKTCTSKEEEYCV